MTSVTTDWAYYEADHIIWRDERAKNRGKFKIINLIARKAGEMVEDLSTQKGTDLYQTNPNGKGFHALTEVIGTQKFGGVDHAAFRSKVYPGGALKLYGSGDDSLAGAIDRSIFGKKMVTHIIVSPITRSQIEEVWVDKGARIEMVRNQRIVDLGIQTFRFRNIDFVVDQFINYDESTGAPIFGIDLDALDLYENPGDTSNGKWEDATVGGYANSYIRVATWTGQLTANRRRTMFRFGATTGFSFN